MSQQSEGVIKKLPQGQQGAQLPFGFISLADDTSIFFHKTALASGKRMDDLVEGDRVNVVWSEGPKGPRAERVERAD